MTTEQHGDCSRQRPLEQARVVLLVVAETLTRSRFASASLSGRATGGELPFVEKQSDSLPEF